MIMKNRRFLVNRLLLLLLVNVMVLTGCGGAAPAQEKSAKEEEVIEIGMCCDSFVIERWEKDRDIFVASARDMGAVVNVQNANGEISKQIEQIEYFINKGVDAIVIISIDADSLEDVIKKAIDKGIKVVAYDRMVNNGNIDLYISFDNEAVGRFMAQSLIDAGLERNRVLMLQGSPTDNNVEQVQRGFMSVAQKNGVEVVDSMYCDGWRAEDASEYLYENPEILDRVDGIMCGNDNLATAVVRVLSENRKAGEIAVVGQDADLEACQRIVEGTQIMTVYKPVEKLAEAAALATISLVRGEELDTRTTIFDGTYDIPSIVLEPIPVTSANIDDAIIASGFHLREEVYLNKLSSGDEDDSDAEEEENPSEQENTNP